ncbi:wall-associated receptor kinase 2-like [Hibiscus syriacus]|uniref:wall-associated receptor kinase 2-like n=1 Tax=Hibiscus syriacus TaxID=106335 RepID=UPI0019227934|nr:wall-associated receptor kinase 2-like [Hibiscus syriacus]
MATGGGIIRSILFSWALFLAAAAVAASQALPGCQDKCGEVSIPFPFGSTPSCYLNENFAITCNHSFSPPRPQLLGSDVVVTNISLEGQLEMLNYVAQDCYDPDGTLVMWINSVLWADMFTISNDKNKLTGVGCDTEAIITAEREDIGSGYFTGCISYCDKMETTLDLNGSCSGIGCCQISIPSGLKNLNISVTSFNNHTNVSDFNPCGYAFVTDESKFSFSFKSFEELANVESLPLVLDWAIGNETCMVAEPKSGYACKENSICYDPVNRSGYICKCKDGYYGNPYLHNGCQDIDECKDSSLHNCNSERDCVNTMGNYTCSCSKGFHGDGRKGGIGCIPNVINVIGIFSGLTVLVFIVGSSWLLFIHKKRRLIKMKKKFFRQNGGFLLQQELNERQVSTETVKIFTAEELQKATKNYDESQIIGKGGFGTVYKGMLKKGTKVAIKKSKVVDQSQIKQFINEVIILSQINHRNVVKLLGCCLETEVPLLVYEFVSNGTLSDHIHCENKDRSISWEIRLRIATESAQVLSYLHSAASTPIIHRDVKPANILLDNNYTAKVSDFGASRLVPLDQTQLSTLVQGTLGYLDPEYLQTSQMNEKSDVYSFGVVLVELLTSKMALTFDAPEEERNLTNYFLKSMRAGDLFQIVDEKVAKGGDIRQIKQVAEVAKRCLRVKSDERPTMKEVAIELEGLRMRHQHPWAEVAVNQEETPIIMYTSE